MLKKLSLIAVIFLLTSCCSREVITVPEIIQIPILPTPELPKLSEEQEQDIEQSTYEILVERDSILRNHILRINKIIEKHNGNS